MTQPERKLFNKYEAIGAGGVTSFLGMGVSSFVELLSGLDIDTPAVGMASYIVGTTVNIGMQLYSNRDMIRLTTPRLTEVKNV